MSDRPLGLAVAGTGWMGTALMRTFLARPGTALRGVYQPRPESAREALRAAGLDPDLHTADYDALVARPDVDAVVVVSPNRFHAPQALTALAAGKHVFCEKPAGTRYADHLALVAGARARPRQVTYVDYILYFDPTEQRLRALIAEGALGRITQIQVNYRHPINISGNKAWKLDAATMGDAIGMGINHALSVMILAMAPQARPARVYATSAPALQRPFQADAIWNILVEFDNGATGFCFGNIDGYNGYDAHHSVSGTEGAFVFDSLQDHPRKIRLWSARRTGGQWVRPLDPACPPEHAWPSDLATPDSGNVIHHQLGGCVDHFLDCVRRGTPSPLGFDHAALIADVGWAARLSALRRRPVDLPLIPGEALAELDG